MPYKLVVVAVVTRAARWHFLMHTKLYWYHSCMPVAIYFLYTHWYMFLIHTQLHWYIFHIHTLIYIFLIHTQLHWYIFLIHTLIYIFLIHTQLHWYIFLIHTLIYVSLTHTASLIHIPYTRIDIYFSHTHTASLISFLYAGSHGSHNQGLQAMTLTVQPSAATVQQWATVQPPCRYSAATVQSQCSNDTHSCTVVMIDLRCMYYIGLAVYCLTVHILYRVGHTLTYGAYIK
jgi:hypothetical protein